MVEPLLSAAGETGEASKGAWKRAGVLLLISLCLVCCVLMILLPAASLAGDLVYRAF
jgi:hypothetical protein